MTITFAHRALVWDIFFVLSSFISALYSIWVGLFSFSLKKNACWMGCEQKADKSQMGSSSKKETASRLIRAANEGAVTKKDALKRPSPISLEEGSLNSVY